jgi:prophage regulatory protein
MDVFKMGERIMRLRDVKAKTGISRATIYLMMKNKNFPKQICLGKRSVGWLESEIESWIQTRISNSRN